VENQWPPKRKSIGRTRALRAIRDFIDRHLTAKAVIAVTILLLLGSWIYPPWILGSYRNVSHGWFFVFDTTRETAMRVDFGRLLLIDAILAAIGGLVAWAVSHQSTARRVAVRLALYALFVPPAIAVFCLGVLIIKNVQREVAKSKFDPFKAGAIPISKPWEQFAQVSTVSANDLRKITLFDVVAKSESSDTSSSYTWLTGFEGRVRNDLPRGVEKIGLKASFYNAQGELIEVRTFWLRSVTGNVYQAAPPVFPNAPISFKNEYDASVNHLPYGWTYLLEVVEAHYVPSEYDVLLKPKQK